jgi:putative transposase
MPAAAEVINYRSHMIFKLAQAAEKHWRRLDGQNQLPKVILGVCFTDGLEVAKEEAQTAA